MMSPERWQKIGELVEAAALLPAEGRPAFLAEACAGDDELRREVEEMLAAYETPDGFIDAPLAEIAAGLLDSVPAGSLVGRELGHFRLESLLGRGGMGEVYLARDTNLSRLVAVKILPPSFAQAPQRVARFQQEARAASALNHPNIVTIYEFGEAEGVSYLAAEYVAGVSLRERMSEPGVTPEQALDIAAQVANALNAAHEAGIIHRDVKPENIMLRRDGFVKVLDFGLAKVTEQSGLRASRGRVTTQSGMVLGTARYMSPEQARGRPLDARTDLFSLGVILYEMLTGQPPFAGETPSHTIVAIIEHNPPPLDASLPPRLQSIVRRALAKDPAARYPTAQALRDDLLRAKNDLAAALPSGGRVFTSEMTASLDTARAGRADTDPEKSPAATRAPVAATQPAVGSWVSRRNFVRAGAGAGLVGLGALAGWRWWGRRARVSELKPPRIRRITAGGDVASPSLSPDGQYLAYVKVEERTFRDSLWVKQIINDSARQILPPTAQRIYGARFCPTDNALYYHLYDIHSSDTSGVYRVPLLGGPARKVLGAGCVPGPFAPDGQRLVYLDGNDGQLSLVTANPQGEDKQLLIRFPAENRRIWSFAWRPDGATVAYAIRDLQNGATVFYMGEVAVSGDGREQIVIPPGRHEFIKSVAWLDAARLLYTAPDPNTKNAQIWLYDTVQQTTRRITNDLAEYRNLCSSADGQTVLAEQSENLSNIWTGDAGHTMRQITNGKNDYNHLSWTADGRLVYASLESGAEEIWVMDADGGNRQQLTNGLRGIWSEPCVGLDGRSIVFISTRSGTRQAWRIDLNGGNLQQLTRSPSGYVAKARLLPDGQTVLYDAQFSGEATAVFRQTPDGATQPLTSVTGQIADWAVSPDGALLAYFVQEKYADVTGLEIFSLTDNKLLKQLPVKGSFLTWAGSSKRLAYYSYQSNAFVTQSWDGGPPQPLPAPGPAPIQATAWSPDGKRLALTCGKSVNDAFLFKFGDN